MGQKDPAKPLAMVTGASSGIGFELALLCARRGFDLIIGADRPLRTAAQAFRDEGAFVEAVEADLSRAEGIDALCAAARGRPVNALFANAGHGLGHAFLDQDFDAVRHVIDTNVTGTLYLLHRIGREMRARNQGRILVTGSVAGFIPGSYQAVYNATKAFLNSFSFALREELKETAVTVTCLMPGPTETEFFARAGLLDTKAGVAPKDSARDVAEVGFEALMRGDGDVVYGWKNKLQTAVANVTPAGVLASIHARTAAPGTAGH